MIYTRGTPNSHKQTKHYFIADELGLSTVNY